MAKDALEAIFSNPFNKGKKLSHFQKQSGFQKLIPIFFPRLRITTKGDTHFENIWKMIDKADVPLDPY